MSTFMANKGNIVRKWYILDAAGKPLGKTAAAAATLLRGKHKPEFTPHADCGDFVVIVNAEKAVLTGKKLEQKYYRRHSGWNRRPQGDQVPPADAAEARAGHAAGRPRHAAPQHHHQGFSVPPAHLRGAEHPHTAQKPETWAAI